MLQQWKWNEGCPVTSQMRTASSDPHKRTVKPYNWSETCLGSYNRTSSLYLRSLCPSHPAAKTHLLLFHVSKMWQLAAKQLTQSRQETLLPPREDSFYVQAVRALNLWQNWCLTSPGKCSCSPSDKDALGKGGYCWLNVSRDKRKDIIFPFACRPKQMFSPVIRSQTHSSLYSQESPLCGPINTIWFQFCGKSCIC